MPETALHFSGVTFGFGKRKPLFENLSCSFVNDSVAGKIVALMGPSGVGKSTFCDLALAVRPPQKGSVRFEPVDANIAFIPQKGVIFDELSVEENIACLKYSKTLGRTFEKHKVQRAIELLDLSTVLQNETRASALSGGEAQRVMLARIQTICCHVLVLDEPCSFLDNRVKDSYLAALRAAVDENRFLALMVTHVWDEARLLADEVVFFHQANGRPVSLHRSPVDQVVNYPPTIDALFAIHWPDCAVLDHSEIISLPGELKHYVPQQACFIGLFRNKFDRSKSDPWVNKLWSYFANLNTDTPSQLHYSRAGNAETLLGNCVFYDEHGVILRAEVRDASRHPGPSLLKTN